MKNLNEKEINRIKILKKEWLFYRKLVGTIFILTIVLSAALMLMSDIFNKNYLGILAVILTFIMCIILIYYAVEERFRYEEAKNIYYHKNFDNFFEYHIPNSQLLDGLGPATGRRV